MLLSIEGCCGSNKCYFSKRQFRNLLKISEKWANRNEMLRHFCGAGNVVLLERERWRKQRLKSHGCVSVKGAECVLHSPTWCWGQAAAFAPPASLQWGSVLALQFWCMWSLSQKQISRSPNESMGSWVKSVRFFLYRNAGSWVRILFLEGCCVSFKQ